MIPASFNFPHLSTSFPFLPLTPFHTFLLTFQFASSFVSSANNDVLNWLSNGSPFHFLMVSLNSAFFILVASHLQLPSTQVSHALHLASCHDRQSCQSHQFTLACTVVLSFLLPSATFTPPVPFLVHFDTVCRSLMSICLFWMTQHTSFARFHSFHKLFMTHSPVTPLQFNPSWSMSQSHLGAMIPSILSAKE